MLACGLFAVASLLVQLPATSVKIAIVTFIACNKFRNEGMQYPRRAHAMHEYVDRRNRMHDAVSKRTGSGC